MKGFKDANGVGDERRFYYAGSSLLLYDSDEPMPIHHFAESGRKARKTSRGKTRVHGAIGFRGYLAGPHVHIVDYFALADPLLARLPAKENPNWRIGHFAREVPPRYGKTAGRRKVEIEDEALAEYYTHVERVTRGPLWSWERFRSIWLLNTGGLDGLVAKYIARDAE